MTVLLKQQQNFMQKNQLEIKEILTIIFLKKAYFIFCH